MKRLILAATISVAGMVMAQDAAPAPEAMSQEKCAIEEKDVDTLSTQ